MSPLSLARFLRRLERPALLAFTVAATVATSQAPLRTTTVEPVSEEITLAPGESREWLIEYAASHDVGLGTSLTPKSVPPTPANPTVGGEDAGEGVDDAGSDPDAGDAEADDAGVADAVPDASTEEPSSSPPPDKSKVVVAQEDVRDGRCAASGEFERTKSGAWFSLESAYPTSMLSVHHGCGVKSGAARVRVTNAGGTTLVLDVKVTMSATDPDVEAEQDPTVDARVVGR